MSEPIAPANDPNAAVPSAAEKSAIEVKLGTAKDKKDTGDTAFKAGDVKSALRSYHEALMYLHGIDKNALKSLGVPSSSPPAAAVDEAAGAKAVNEKTEVDIMLERIYANMSACHLKQGNWKRALDTADKALAKNESNPKAMFRKAKALGELGYFEKAEKILEDLKKKSPSEGPMADAELARLRAADKERQKAHDQKMRGWLSREKKSAPATEAA
ncbi:TPR-like protein [Leucogyrophana mollusca]|uniref:TPR-like protein n=1 Tax=Leucogyrophana mollusca TaxID=85980 RepID=A0ACB8BW71_9AGAM|nr:TPR-like protein [Leucogyrophana mollusca]